jgi:hypothetical protein
MKCRFSRLSSIFSAISQKLCKIMESSQNLIPTARACKSLAQHEHSSFDVLDVVGLHPVLFVCKTLSVRNLSRPRFTIKWQNTTARV